jgi:hypothetical protein
MQEGVPILMYIVKNTQASREIRQHVMYILIMSDTLVTEIKQCVQR